MSGRRWSMWKGGVARDGVRSGEEWEEVEHVEGWSGQGWSEEG